MLVRRLLKLSALALLVVLPWACASAGGPGLPNVAGDYRGAVMIQGQGVDGTLSIDQAGSALGVTFDAPGFDLMATGQGMLRPDGTARIVLSYDLQCPGEAIMVGAFTDDGTRFEGEIRAEDCTGEIPGTFSFGR